MFWIGAGPIPAKMVNLSIGWNWTNKSHVTGAMGGYLLALIVDLGVSILRPIASPL
jgi:hypothetical protein